MILGIKTEIKWINGIAETPLIGGIFAFMLIFMTPVLCSFLCQAIIPGFENDPMSRICNP